MDVKRIKVSLVINLLVVFLATLASIMMFTGFKFMHGYEIILESTKLGMFRFFTVQSNLFVGIVSLIFAIKEVIFLRTKKNVLTFNDYLWKLMAVVAIGLTFVIVFAYLGPISKGGIMSMLMNSNLFFHLIIPVLSILNFVFFERTNLLKYKHTFYGLLPTIAYQIYYLINILGHMENGKVSPTYDWYWFLQNGVWTAFIVAPLILLVTYIISVVIWKLNKNDLVSN